jgi:ATP-binding protein involved in chromosome partitioning
MSQPIEAAVREALAQVLDPELHVDLVSAGMVKSVRADGGRVHVEIELTTPACPLKDRIEADVRAALGQVDGIESLELAFGARVRAAGGAGGRAPLPGIRNIVAVASGKGGVGKSTVAVNLAVALAQDGARVGLMDADIYGPSVPALLGLESEQPQVQGRKMLPFTVETSGEPVKVMSMAFFLEDDQPVVWRGPMLHKALQQFLQDVAWGELDYLVVDMPPGTGDVQLSLSQTVPLTGAVIVTTPQDVALLDVKKAVVMFEKVGVPVLGLVENMAAFHCPGCGQEHPIFGEGGGKAYAERAGFPLLGSIPLESAVREGGDAGRPAVARAGDQGAGAALVAVARNVAAQVSLRARETGGTEFSHELPIVG